MISKFEGCLLGCAVGDAVGAPVESKGFEHCAKYVNNYVRPRRFENIKRPPMFREPEYSFGQITDDTQLTSILALSIIKAGKVDPGVFADLMLKGFQKNLVMGSGRSTREAVKALASGVRWQEAGAPAPAAGNGTAMRAGPLGLFCSNPNEMSLTAYDISRVTHQNPICTAGTIAISTAVALALQGKDPEGPSWAQELDIGVRPFDALMADEINWVWKNRKESPDIVSKYIERHNVQMGKRVWERISPYVLPSVLWSIYSFLHTPKNFWETICTSVYPGGDVDTTGAMAGAISGTYNGVESIPKDVLDKLQDRGKPIVPRLKKIATMLLEAKQNRVDKKVKPVRRENSMQFENLVKKIEEARIAYYGSGKPIMSDAEYDSLEEELRKLDPEHWILTSVGAPPRDNGWEKVKHPILMGSLNKAQGNEEVESWAEKTEESEFFLTEKLDGISLLASYDKGKLIRAATRGDGTIGEDITRNVSLMQGVPQTIPDEWSGHVRGEIICLKSDFKKHFEGESNPRNTASGTAKRQTNPEKCKYLTLMTYQVLPDKGGLESKSEEFKEAVKLGFRVPNHYLCSGTDEVEGIYQDYINKERDLLDYDIDGLVVEVDSHEAFEKMGVSSGKPKGAIAYKFPHEMGETTLEDVIWQTGNTGRVTPVAIFEEIVLAGAKVRRASLATAKRFTELGLTRGCRILVSRRNDVIPRVEANLSK